MNLLRGNAATDSNVVANARNDRCQPDERLPVLALPRATDKVLAHADCQSAIQPIDNRRYSVAQTGSLLYRRLLTGYAWATTCANFVNGPVALPASLPMDLEAQSLVNQRRFAFETRIRADKNP